MKKLFLWVFIFPFFHQLLAQNISGMVQYSSQKPAAFANILLLHPKDSTLVKGAVSDQEGKYRFENIPNGTFLISGNIIGYKKTYIPFTVNKNDEEAPLMILDEDVTGLDEVVVEATRPLIEQDNFRTLINVANSIIATGTTALEVLEKAPGVSVDRQNDGISMMGRENVIVQIDGKQTYLAMRDVVALLRSMSSDNIDQIELISTPSAKYDAEGNSGIINIILEKNENIGTNGSVSLSGGSGRYPRGNGSMQLNHMTEKLNFFGNINADQGGSYWHFNLFRDQADGEQRNLVNQNSYIRFLNKGKNAKAGIDYFINKNTTLGIVWTGFWNNVDEKSPAYTSFRREYTGPFYFQQLTDKTLGNVSSNHIANLNIQHQFGVNEAVLTADLDLGVFNRHFTNNLTTSTLIPSSSDKEVLFTEMPTDIEIKTFKVDFSQVFPEKWKLETGYKISEVKSNNNMTLRRGPQDNVQIDPLLSNHFQYSERIHAVYMNISGNLFYETEIQIGLRAEQTNSTAQSLNLDEKVKRSYLNFFPTLFLSRKIAEKQSLSFSYGYRIDRPNYQNLNPGRSYLDPYAFGRGNPYLKPQYTHTLELKHSLDNKVFTSLSTNYVNDLIFWVLQPVDNQSAERTVQNFGKSQLYSWNMSFPVTILKDWTIQTTLLGVYKRFQFQFLGSPMNAEQISGRVNLINSILLGKGWTAEMTGWIRTPAQEAFIHSPWMGTLDLGLQKSLGSNWKAKINLQDVFHTYRFVGTGMASDFVQKFDIRRDTRILLLNLSYSFGNQQLKKNRQRKTGADEEINRTN